MSGLTYAGRAFRFSIDNGTVFENTYTADGAGLRYQTVAGPGTGTVEKVDLQAAEVTPGVFLVG